MGHTPDWTLRGRRVGLCRPGEEDEQELLALRRESADFHAPWEPEPTPGRDPYGPEAFALSLARSRQPSDEHNLVRRLEDGLLVGAVNLSNIARGIQQSASMGWWVGRPHAGQGYLTEAVGLALTRAFDELGLHRVEANIQPGNAPSLALARRAGFLREGYSPRFLRIAGAWRDHERWALTLEDWQARR